jgi:hypothetical protein
MRKAALLALPASLAALLLLAACTRSGNLKVPFITKEAPFVPTAVPSDFAIRADENHDTYYSRQHIAQQISAGDAMSKTTYTTFRDYNNSVSNKFSQETPLSPQQLQAMWDEVSKHNLLDRSIIWANWFSGADLYKRDAYTLQIRANGQTKVYRTTNGFPGATRTLILQMEAVRLPLSKRSNTRVIAPTQEIQTGPRMPEPAAPQPSETPADLLPLTPETQPTTTPAATTPAAPSMD